MSTATPTASLAPPMPVRTRESGRRRGATRAVSSAAMARTWRDLFITEIPPPPPPEGEDQEERSGGFFRRLRENMSKSRQALGAELQATVFQTLDDEMWERLEETLIYADVGASTTAQIVERLETEAGSGALSTGQELKKRLQELLAGWGRAGGGRVGRSFDRPGAHEAPPGAAGGVGARGGGPDRPATPADGDPHGRRERHRQDDDDRQDRVAPLERAPQVRPPGGRGHLPCGSGR